MMLMTAVLIKMQDSGSIKCLALRGSVCETLGWLHVQSIPPRTGASDDTPSATHDRRHAGAELGAAYPGHVCFACLAVCPSLLQIAGIAGSRRNPWLSAVLDKPTAAGAEFDRRHHGRPSLPIQCHPQERVEPRSEHPRSQTAQEVAGRS